LKEEGLPLFHFMLPSRVCLKGKVGVLKE